MPKGLGGGLGLLKDIELTPGRIIGGLIGKELFRPKIPGLPGSILFRPGWIGMLIGQEIGYWIEKGINEFLFGESPQEEEKKPQRAQKRRQTSNI